MSDRPRVSVLMPFLDSASFITESIESVRAQTCPDWELLLCDDGSSDGTTEIAQRYAASDPHRIRWLEHEGHQTRGASAARNLGLRHARGEFVAFLDADDVWVPQKLSEQLAILDSRPEADALCGSSLLWYGWTGKVEDISRDHVLLLGPPHGSFWPAPQFLAHRLRGRAASPATCSLIVRHDAVRRAGGFEESFTTVYTDQAFYVKLFLRSSLLVVDTCWDRYRQHPHSAVASVTREGQMRAAKLRYLLWARDYFAAHDVQDPAVRAALRWELWGVRNPTAYQLVRKLRHGYRAVRAWPHRIATNLLPSRR